MALDFNAMCDFEEKTGKNALQTLEAIEKKIGDVSITDMRILMWAALKQFHEEMTLPLAGKIMSENIDAVARAISIASPEVGDSGNGKPARKRSKTGTRP
ncbi:hypothetical protein [Falsirhodobacter halotolerans]|uniref:hypothetical protein n=1 Tax=Falsirhodobacter halotolerans TaxID=1146892 RepID=UPI001FD38ED3|nr:hypothetical protein [Falsirhodobacter halotolerans]MCJ8139564.1 hypothetical protein [Falsirhodobacter halotolerans]